MTLAKSPAGAGARPLHQMDALQLAGMVERFLGGFRAPPA